MSLIFNRYFRIDLKKMHLTTCRVTRRLLGQRDRVSSKNKDTDYWSPAAGALYPKGRPVLPVLSLSKGANPEHFAKLVLSKVEGLCINSAEGESKGSGLLRTDELIR